MIVLILFVSNTHVFIAGACVQRGCFVVCSPRRLRCEKTPLFSSPHPYGHDHKHHQPFVVVSSVLPYCLLVLEAWTYEQFVARVTSALFLLACMSLRPPLVSFYFIPTSLS